MTASRPDVTQELEYPPIRVNRSLAQLDLDTLIMRSNPRDPAHEATPLEDSTYEVLDNPADLSDDDGHTASVTSTSPDDMSVTLSETESEGEDDFEDNDIGETEQLGESVAADPLDDQVIAAGEDSTLTERPALGDSDSSFHFKMEELPTDSPHGTEGFTIVKEFTPEQSTSKVLEPYGCSEIRLTVRAGLVDRFFPDRGSFRVLFVGQMDAWSEEGIKSSLLNALLASSGSSKSVMVDGQMQSYSPVLHADRCIGIETHERGKGNRLVFKLEGGGEAERLLNNNSEKHYSDAAPIPDLAIFCHPKAGITSLNPSECNKAREILLNKGIPSIDITDHRRFNEASPGFSPSLPESLHVRVEGRRASEGDFESVDRLPVDVYTFMHLDPSDLNRHLAAISPRLHPHSSSRNGKKATWGPTRLLPDTLQQADAPWKMVMAILVLSMLITATFLNGLPLQAKQGNPMSEVIPAASSTTLTRTISVVNVITTPEPARSSATALSVKDKIDEFFAKQLSSAEQIKQIEMKQLRQAAVQLEAADRARKEAQNIEQQKASQNAEQQKAFTKLREKLEKKSAEIYLREVAAKAKKIGVFEIQIRGDQQFILHPSKRFVGRTRKPQIQIQVTRDAKPVPIRYERTIDGVYVVELEKEYPAGFFNVSIATHSKPLMQQSFNISLGHHRSLLQQWLGVAQREGGQLASVVEREALTAQKHLQGLSHKFAERLQTFSLQLFQNRTHIWGNRSREMVERVQEATKEVDRQLAEAREQTWNNLRQATAPARTSRRTLWARNNAYLVRCGFERAVGLSSKDKDGKKTRSCEAANW